MPAALDRDIRKLERLIEKYCREDKKEKALEMVVWAGEYANDFPQKADIEEAVSLVTNAETYISEEGKPLYKEVRERVVKRLWRLLEKKNASLHN